jgi:hypothetical protein
VKVAKNVTDKIPILGNIMYITNFVFYCINEVVEMPKDEYTNWVDWTKYGVGKVMDFLTFIPGIGQLISFIESGMDFFLQRKSQVLNVKKMNNPIQLENANNEVC